MSEPLSPHLAVYGVCRSVARAISGVVPKGFRGKIVVVVDNGVVSEQDVSVEFRPPQPKAGMGK